MAEAASDRDPAQPSRAIASELEARALAQRLAAAPAIAVDTEGDGMYRYRSRLCAMQFASDCELAVVDSLAVDGAVFAELLSERGPEKVMHDAAFDARLLRAHGVKLGAVFDTAVAARFLGFAATGLAALLAGLCHVQLPKGMQQADWGKRPLEPDALRYLEDDVRYLLPLRELLLARVRAQGIEPEVREECAYVLAEAERSPLEPSPFARVKGGAARPPRERARLYELALVRDALARELDLPASRVIANDLLLRLAQLDAASPEVLARRLGPPARPWAGRFAEALARAEARHDAPPDELTAPSVVPPPSVLARRKLRRELLTSFRSREAEAREVDPQVVLPGHCLHDLVKLDRLDDDALSAVPGFGACRVERYGEPLRRELGPRWG